MQALLIIFMSSSTTRVEFYFDFEIQIEAKSLISRLESQYLIQ